MNFTDQTAAGLLRELNAGRLSSVEVTEAYLAQIAPTTAKSGRSSASTPTPALARAEEIDQRRAAGKPLGRLAGMPVAVKDVLCTAGEPTTCASRMLENFRPPYDATVIARLKAADAVLLGRTNMDEFAMGGSNENSAFFPTRNPWDSHAGSRRLQRRLGGLRGRPAWPRWSLGTDTGGSIRCPAGPVRHQRLEAHLRARQPLRAGGLRQQPRPDRPAGQKRPKTWPSCWKSSPGTTPGLDLHRPARAAVQRRRSGSRWRVCGSAWCASISARGWTARWRRPSARRWRCTSRWGPR